MRTLTTLFVVALLAPYSLAEVELAGTPNELKAHLAKASARVVLTAQAELEVEADRALVKLEVLTKDRKLRNALGTNHKMRAELMKHLKSNGIGKDNVKSSRYSSVPKPGLFTQVGSYEVRNSVTVAVDSERQFQIIAEFIDKHKEVSYEGITFEHSDEQQLKLDVIKSACQNLGEKGAAYEQALGVKLELVTFRALPVAATQASAQYAQDHYRIAPASASASYDMASTLAEGVSPGPSLFSEMTFTSRIAGEFKVVSQ